MSFNLILRSGNGKNEDGESGLPWEAAAHPLVDLWECVLKKLDLEQERNKMPQ